MKKTKITFRLVLAALAATAALVSCTKEPTPGQTDQTPASPAAEGTRVIAVSFGPQTKTSFTSTEDGIQPTFDDKDSILLVSWPKDSDPIKDTCIVSVDDKGIATISTNLTGDLTAIYPAKYAQQQKGTYGFIVPPIQTGKFKDANICGTQIGEGENSAQFMNLSTLFIIEPPTTSVKSLTVKSLNTEQSGQRTGERARINISNNAGDNRNVIHVPNGPCNDGKYYVAVATNGKDDVNLSDLSFEVKYETSGTGAVKGITTSAIAAAAGHSVGTAGYNDFNTVVSGISYTIDKNNWHDYVEIDGRKWATMNIGAENPTDAGRYFMWGETTGLTADQISTTNFPSVKYYNAENNSWNQEKGFDWDNCPWTYSVYNSSTNTNAFTKYILIDQATTYGDSNVYDDKTVLDLEDDAAYVHWGGAWRMPIIEEFDALKASKIGDFSSGYYFGVSDETKIFLPATGNCYEMTLDKDSGYSDYWSSSLGGSDTYFARRLFFNNSNVSTNVGSRCLGHSIRAIVDDPDYIAMAD